MSTTRTWKKETRSDSVCIQAPQAAWLAAWATVWSPPGSCIASALPTTVVPFFYKHFWGDTRSSICSAKCLVQHKKWSTFKENQTAPTTSAVLPCLPGKRDRYWWGKGRATSTGSQQSPLWRPVSSPGLRGHWEESVSVSWHVDGGAVSKDRQLHLASWLDQQFSQEVWREHIS